MKKRENMKLFTKKAIIKIASCVTILSIVASLFCINIHANDSEDELHLDTYAAYYFHKLNSTPPKIGLNTEGTCVYVAIGMLLSFYDSYLNDKFIDDDYEELGLVVTNTASVYSSGIKQEGDWKETTYLDYSSFITANAGKYFHLKLIQIARDDLHLYDQSTQNQRNTDSTPNPEETDWSINLYEAKDVIEEYFSQITYSAEEIERIEDNVTINISSYNDSEHVNLSDPNGAIRNEMIEKVKAGIPVVYSGHPELGEGHAMIAYYYDEENDTVYFHTGWNENTVITDKDVGEFIYTTKTKIMWFEIDEDYTHVCSNSYAYSSSPETGSLCACQMYSSSPSHIHNYNAIGHNIDCHYSKCICSKIANIEAHNLTYPDYNPVFHREECEDCSYMDFKSHEYTNFLSYTSTNHDVACACGATTTEAHYAYRYKSLDNSLHTVYCECGQEWTSPHVVESGSYTGGNKYALCLGCRALVTVGMTLHPTTNDLPRSANGSFILPNGVIVLVNEDIEAYFNGTLEFIYPDDNLETE